MELWIRSQNKDFLEKCSGLYIAHTDDDIWSIINSITMTIYGKYATRTRVLEVLDEIQKRLIDMQNLKFSTEYFKNIQKETRCVYEMPEE